MYAAREQERGRQLLIVRCRPSSHADCCGCVIAQLLVNRSTNFDLQWLPLCLAA